MAGAIAAAVTAPGTVGATGARSSRMQARAAQAPAGQRLCLIHSLPSFVAQGEGQTEATAADIVEVECNPNFYGTGSPVRITANQLFNRCGEKLSWIVPDPFERTTGRGVTVKLDVDGNATVALVAGPHCQTGESLVSAHLEAEPFETFTTSFTVLPSEPTAPGVYAMPGIQVEDANSSAVATIVQAEFAGGSEKPVHIAAQELFDRCRVGPKLRWFQMLPTIDRGGEVRETTGPEITEVPLDNDGNAFAVAIGDASCAPGTSLIEADLESKPFTTYTTTFAVLPPQPTAEPAFAIEKRQEIGGSGFTTSPLTGAIGDTVNYQIVVTNTGTVPEDFGEFSDLHCDGGTLAGGPGSNSVAPGASTTYTCRHVLGAVGSYANEATVTANTVGGLRLTQASNQVLVEVPEPPAPAFTIEKLQKVMGGSGDFTTSPLTAAPSQTIEYEVIVANTGKAPLSLSSLMDARCDSGTIAGGPGALALAPGASSTYTCTRLLASAGTYINEAGITATAREQPPLTHASNVVEATVSAPARAPAPQTPPGGDTGPLLAEAPSVPRLQVRTVCEAALPVLHGAAGPKRGIFTLKISAVGVKRITFYLDARKLKTLRAAQSKSGKFTVTIDARRLSYGPHRVSIKAIMSDRNCASVARSGVFVHPRSGTKPFLLTG